MENEANTQVDEQAFPFKKEPGIGATLVVSRVLRRDLEPPYRVLAHKKLAGLRYEGGGILQTVGQQYGDSDYVLTVVDRVDGPSSKYRICDNAVVTVEGYGPPRITPRSHDDLVDHAEVDHVEHDHFAPSPFRSPEPHADAANIETLLRQLMEATQAPPPVPAAPAPTAQTPHADSMAALLTAMQQMGVMVAEGQKTMTELFLQQQQTSRDERLEALSEQVQSLVSALKSQPSLATRPTTQNPVAGLLGWMDELGQATEKYRTLAPLIMPDEKEPSSKGELLQSLLPEGLSAFKLVMGQWLETQKAQKAAAEATVAAAQSQLRRQAQATAAAAQARGPARPATRVRQPRKPVRSVHPDVPSNPAAHARRENRPTAHPQGS